MAKSPRNLLTLVLIIALWESASGQAPRFFADDPIQAMPAPLPVGKLLPQKINDNFDFLINSERWTPPPPKHGEAVNTLGEVPDSEWFTNRHTKRRMTRDELQRGPGSSAPPTPPFTVTGGKIDGITPGFRMKDSRKRSYFVKVDPSDYPELTSGADVIGSKLLYAIGYNTPENEVVDLTLGDLGISDKAVFTPRGEPQRKMTWTDVERMVSRIPHYPDGSFRIIASLSVEGEIIGPFQYEGTRADDPNDIVPHEDRRDLRGLRVFYAWLNNTDTKANNTIDTIVAGNGTRFVRHYVIDFGSSLGSDGDNAKDPRLGNEFVLPTPMAALKQTLSLGLWPAPWERVHYPVIPAVGHFESQLFDPEKWKPNFPNLAFMSCLPDDAYWATKQVMAFTDDDIRAIVERGKFTNPQSTEYLTKTLAERRDKIGRTYFSKVLPLDRFRVENNELVFDDLAVRYGFHSARSYEVRWSEFDNIQQTHTPIAGSGSARLPGAALKAASGSYFSAAIDAPGDPLKPVSVYLRKDGNSYKVVGVDRAW
jgi:hypothetical protein